MIDAGDSFFTLTPWARLGLVVVSAGMAAAVLLVLRIAVVRRGLGVRVALALGAFWVFVWLSPQGHYAYYRWIFEGLPAQVVVGAPPGPAILGRLITFSGSQTLSAYGTGAIGWLALMVAALSGRVRNSSRFPG